MKTKKEIIRNLIATPFIGPVRKHVLAIYALTIVGILGLVVLIRNYPIPRSDYYITHALQGIKSDYFRNLMTFVSLFGDSGMLPISVIFVSLVLYVNHYHRESRFILATLIADILNLLVKLLVNRPRPTIENCTIMCKVSDPGFPSGHVVHYVVLFGFLIAVMLVKNNISMFLRIFVGVFSVFLILTVPISRIYLGAHWATDVLGGYLFGIIYLGAILTFYLKDLIEHQGRDPEPKV